jgi:hypothetical protein
MNCLVFFFLDSVGITIKWDNNKSFTGVIMDADGPFGVLWVLSKC